AAGALARPARRRMGASGTDQRVLPVLRAGAGRLVAALAYPASPGRRRRRAARRTRRRGTRAVGHGHGRGRALAVPAQVPHVHDRAGAHTDGGRDDLLQCEARLVHERHADPAFLALAGVGLVGAVPVSWPDRAGADGGRRLLRHRGLARPALPLLYVGGDRDGSLLRRPGAGHWIAVRAVASVYVAHAAARLQRAACAITLLHARGALSRGRGRPLARRPGSSRRTV